MMVRARRTVIYFQTMDRLYNSAALLLISKRLWIGVHGIARSILELHVDLLNFLKDPKYLQHLEASNLQAWVKFCESALAGNPFLHTVMQLPEMPKQLDQRRQRLAELKKLGYGPLRFREKFDRAGFTHEYQSAYAPKILGIPRRCRSSLRTWKNDPDTMSFVRLPLR
jgi:hypothetical protein